MSKSSRMLGWFNDATVRASTSKRRKRSGSCVNVGGRTLMATSRPKRVSFARYTSPMPPAPMAPSTSYGPSFVPALKDISGLYQFLLNGCQDRIGGRTCLEVGKRAVERDDRRIPHRALDRLGVLGIDARADH